MSPPDAVRRLQPIDVGVVVLLLTGLAFYVRFAMDLGGRPEEDAAMLLRYSRHLADGHGIVWNIGEPPVDGATDFLFMVAVALLHRLGLGLETAARALGLGSHVLTVVGVYLGPRLLFGAAPPLAFLGAAFLAVGPGLRHVAACYGTPFFALWALVAFVLAVQLALAEKRVCRPALLFALAALVLGLARPEGVFLGGFFLVAALQARRGEGGQTITRAFLGVLLTLGLAYFLWRWHYFGHPLPNPFYKKGGGVLHLHSLRMAWRDLWTLGLPFLVVLPLGLLDRRARRWAAFTLLPVLLFVSLWILIADETNYVARFRHPVLPVVLVGWVPVAMEIGGRLSLRPVRVGPVPAWVAAFALAAGLVVWQHHRYGWIVPRPMGLHDAALVLRDYTRYNYALVTTEAGLLPLYSTWRSVDAWGLNDAFIAREGGVTEAYLDRYRPEVIVFHAYFSPQTPQEGPRIENRSLGPAWYRMVVTLKRYAETRGYILSAVFGRNAWDTHWYYVRAGFPHSAEIVDRIRALDYLWDGEPTVDFAVVPPLEVSAIGDFFAAPGSPASALDGLRRSFPRVASPPSTNYGNTT